MYMRVAAVHFGVANCPYDYTRDREKPTMRNSAFPYFSSYLLLKIVSCHNSEQMGVQEERIVTPRPFPMAYK